MVATMYFAETKQLFRLSVYYIHMRNLLDGVQAFPLTLDWVQAKLIYNRRIEYARSAISANITNDGYTVKIPTFLWRQEFELWEHVFVFSVCPALEHNMKPTSTNQDNTTSLSSRQQHINSNYNSDEHTRISTTPQYFTYASKYVHDDQTAFTIIWGTATQSSKHYDSR